MKKSVGYALSALLVMALLQLSACKKFFPDFDEDHPHFPIDSLCRISQITSYGYGTSDTNTYYFSYNAQGNPTAIRPAAAFRSAKPTYVFAYDTLNRLQSLMEITYHDSSVSPNPNDGIVHNYYFFGYTGNRISSASITCCGTVYNGLLIFSKPIVSTHVNYEYDSLDRIVRTQTYLPFTPPFYTDYPYNSTGNLTAYATNDHKINVFRTHAYWQFLARDYSVNNPLSGASYNMFKLPVLTTQSAGRDFLSNRFSIDHAAISYDCSCGSTDRF